MVGPGGVPWFAGFTAHMPFVRDHHKEVERLAIVTDSPLAGIA